MANENVNGAEGGLLENSGMDQFQGFSTKDGEVVTQKSKVPAAKNGAAKPTAKQKAAIEEGEEPEEGADADETTPAAETKRRDAQERINKAVGRQRAAERERDTLRSQNSALETRLAALEARVNAPPLDPKVAQRRQHDPEAPSPEDYEFGELDARYISDLARHETRKEIKQQQSAQQTQQQSAQQTQAQQAALQRANEFKDKGLDKYDDFEDVVFDNNTPISPVLAELFFESDLGVDIAYQLASDSKEAKRVSAMTPARQAAWFGQREAELSSGSSDADEDDEDNGSVTPPKTTRAPPPPATKTRGSGGQQQTSAATTDFAAFERMAAKP